MREFSDLVRIEIAKALPHGCPTIQTIAQQVQLSRRTLQRRLALDGSSFSIELDAVRRDHALAVLKGGPISVSELSNALGYKQQASLSRAVRRWTGCTPRALQNRS